MLPAVDIEHAGPAVNDEDLRVLRALDDGPLTANQLATNRDRMRRLCDRGLVIQDGVVRSGTVGQPAKLYARTALGDLAARRDS